jgi:hypothetical protein
VYRALISVPISAKTDNDAYERAQQLAASLMEEGAVIGHVEAVYALPEGDLLRAGRVVWIDPSFEKQIP